MERIDRVNITLEQIKNARTQVDFLIKKWQPGIFRKPFTKRSYSQSIMSITEIFKWGVLKWVAMSAQGCTHDVEAEIETRWHWGEALSMRSSLSRALLHKHKWDNQSLQTVRMSRSAIALIMILNIPSLITGKEGLKTNKSFRHLSSLNQIAT